MTTTVTLPNGNLVDDLVGNFQGNTMRIPIARLAAMMAALMGPTYATRSGLNNDKDWPAGSIGYVRNDPTAGYNGVYKKQGGYGTGNWTRVGDLPSGALETALVDAEAALRIAGDRESGVLRLVNVAGADAITADLADALTGISIATGRMLRLVPAATNTTATPTLTVGGQVFLLQSASGGDLKAGALVAGRLYLLYASSNSRLRLISDASAADLIAERSATIANFGTAGMVRLTSVTGTADAIKAEVPSGAADLGAGANGTHVLLRPTATNTIAAPTLQIGSGPVRALYSETNGALGIGRLIANAWHIIYLASNGNAQVQGIFVKPSELPTLREAVTTSTALVSAVTGTVDALAAKKTLEYALQTASALPARPNATVVHWLTWTDPSAVMGPVDLWFALPTPTVPDMPTDASWRWHNARTGTGAMLQIVSIPEANPALTALQYSLNGGAWTAIALATGETAIEALVSGGTYGLSLRYVNFVGAGVPTAVRQVTISNADFVDSFDRADQNLSTDARWADIVVGGNGRRTVITGNSVRPAASNETFVSQVQEYFAANQFVEATILDAGTNTSDGRGSMIYARMTVGAHTGYRLQLAGTTWRLSRVIAGTATTLASGTHGLTYPITARLAAVGSVLTAQIGGSVVATVTDAGASALVQGTIGLGVNAAGADGISKVQIGDIKGGNA